MSVFPSRLSQYGRGLLDGSLCGLRRVCYQCWTRRSVVCNCAFFVHLTSTCSYTCKRRERLTWHKCFLLSSPVLILNTCLYSVLSAKLTGCVILFNLFKCLSLLIGAGRLELCSSLLEGGLTPSLGEHSSLLYRYSYTTLAIAWNQTST